MSASQGCIVRWNTDSVGSALGQQRCVRNCCWTKTEQTRYLLLPERVKEGTVDFPVRDRHNPADLCPNLVRGKRREQC